MKALNDWLTYREDRRRRLKLDVEKPYKTSVDWPIVLWSVFGTLFVIGTLLALMLLGSHR